MEHEDCSKYRNVTDISNGTIQIEEYDQSKSILLTMYIVLISLIIPGNISVVFYMWKKKHFSSNFSVYATSLAVTDLSVAIIDIPLYIADLLHPDWFINIPMCILLKLLGFVLTSVSIFLVDAIAYDRYVCVTSPLLYRSQFTRRRSVIISTAMWILGFVVWIPYFLSKHFNDVYSVTVLGICDSLFGYFTLGQAVLAYYIPALFLIVVYILLLRALTKRTIIVEFGLKTRRKNDIVENELNQDVNFVKGEVKPEQIRQTIGSPEEALAAEAHSQSVTPRTFSEEPPPRRLSAETHQIKLFVENLPTKFGCNLRPTAFQKSPQISIQNRASFKTISVVVFVFLLCWVPFCIVWPMMGPCDVYDFVHTFFIILTYANSAFNPFIYVLTSKSIRSDIIDVFRRRNPTS